MTTRSAVAAPTQASALVLERPEDSNSILDVFLKKLRTREARIGVLGLGYVGLPLVRLFAGRGFTVTGFDVDESKIARLNRGESYILSVPSSTIKLLQREKRMKATTDFSKLAGMDAVIICVPTPLNADGSPDLSYIKATGKAIGQNLRRGQLVILESTSHPGTTREVLKPELEKSGLRCGKDFMLAFSPEREDPGNKRFTNATIPKIVGGMDDNARRAAAGLYGRAVARVVEVSSCEVAEAAKILENTYRCVNIALVNELKMCFDRMGIDVWEVIEAAATKPFGFQAFQPGPGLGGHCIPIDPFYLSRKAREYQFNTRMIDLAGEVNVQMPYYVVGKLEEALRSRGRSLSGARIFLLGLAYKKDIDDPRESPAFKIIELLEAKGARVVTHDPSFKSFPMSRHWKHLKAKAAPLTEGELEGSDAVLVATDHSSYDYAWIAKHAGLIVDTRNAFKDVKLGREKIIRA